jgi:hypothetical protein
VSQTPPSWPPPGLAERLADLEAGRHSISPPSPAELAMAADMLALGTALLANDAARRQLPLPVTPYSARRHCTGGPAPS